MHLTVKFFVWPTVLSTVGTTWTGLLVPKSVNCVFLYKNVWFCCRGKWSSGSISSSSEHLVVCLLKKVQLKRSASHFGAEMWHCHGWLFWMVHPHPMGMFKCNASANLKL